MVGRPRATLITRASWDDVTSGHETDDHRNVGDDDEDHEQRLRDSPRRGGDAAEAGRCVACFVLVHLALHLVATVAFRCNPRRFARFIGEFSNATLNAT